MQPATNADVDSLNRRYGGPGRIVFRTSATGSPIVSLANRYGSCEIQLFGAQVMQYRPTGNPPVFWNAQPLAFDPARDVHGGLPVCWPWFGRCGEPGSRSHGFARIMPWAVKASEYSDDETSVTLLLESSEATRRLWPHEFSLEYRISLSMKLNVELRTANTGDAPFAITEGFHPYFLVRERDLVTVRGLDGCPFCDARATTEMNAVWTGDLAVTAAYDHVFDVSKREWALIDPGLRRAIAVVARGNRRIVTWTPGEEGIAAVAGALPDDWRRFVCVEPATLFADAAVTVNPGETHELLAAIQSVPDDGSVHARS